MLLKTLRKAIEAPEGAFTHEREAEPA